MTENPVPKRDRNRSTTPFQEKGMTERTNHVARIGEPSIRSLLQTDTTGTMAFNAPLPAYLLNIEAKRRSNLFPWRGQFSPQLVETLLRAYATSGSVVLDPFMGSGTVLVESARLGFPVHGREVNPAAYLLGRVYELCNLDVVERRELLYEAETFLAHARPAAFELPLFHAEAGMTSPSGRHSDWMRAIPDPRVRMLLEALVVLADGDAAHDGAHAGKWSTIKEIVTRLPFTTTPLHPLLGDARSLGLPDGEVDFVLTSPPYINVFNYHHNSRVGIESLGWKPLVVARSEIGSNRKFRQNRFLTVVQYCMDMALALTEIRRACNNTARVLLILGRESNVHKTAFYNGRIVERLAMEQVGFHLDLKQERMFMNRFGQSIREDVLHLSPQSGPSRPKEDIVDGARRLGKDVLSEALQRTPSDRRPYLEDAIRRADEVQASPIFNPAAATE